MRQISLAFAVLSVFITSPIFAAEIDQAGGSTRDRQSYEWIKERKVDRNIASEQRAKQEAKEATDAQKSNEAAATAKCCC